MSDRDDILISVQGRFIDSILAGTKRVELRRRAPRVAAGTRIWIYDKAPVAAVRAVAILAMAETMAPDVLWHRYAATLGLSHDEYQKYVLGCKQATALSLKHVAPMLPVSLSQLRKLNRDFHPPQFYLRLETQGSLIMTLERYLHRTDLQSDIEQLDGV